MTGRAKARGDWAERVVCEAFKRLGFPWASRVKAGAQRDTGDIHLTLGQLCIAQIKNVRTPRWMEWMGELDEQKTNAGAHVAFLVWKPVGVGESRVDEWLSVMKLSDHTELLRRAGYGTELDE